MYRFLKSSMIFLLAGVLFFSCKESEAPVLEVPSTVLNQSFGPEGGTQTISVNCNQDFTAESSDKSWCNVEVIKNQSVDNLVITVAENKGLERTAKIAVTTSGLDAIIITVTQAETFLSVSPTDLNLSFDSGESTKSITVKYSQDFTAKSSISWCSVEIIKNQLVDNLVITVTNNKGLERTAEIVVTTAGSEDVIIKVTQAVAPFLSVPSPQLNQFFDQESSTRSITVTCNKNNVTAESSDKSWCNVEVVKNPLVEGLYTLVIRVSANQGSERTAEIALKVTGLEDLIVKATQWASDYEAVSIRVATYNTGAWTQSEPIHEWANRGPVLCQLIRDHDFDIFGQQEGIYAMLSDMLGTEYGYIGSGNTAQLQGQRSAICYKKNKFEVLENGDYWNSSTPEVPGSSSSKCTWGKFREKASGREFYFFNSHFDVSSEANRNLAANLMLSRAKALAGDYPVFCTGDFNSFPTTEPIRILLAGNFLKSAYDASETPRYGSDGTYNDFNLSNPTARIDYIMVTKGIRIMTYGVLNDRPGGHYPSDHDPVVVDVKF